MNININIGLSTVPTLEGYNRLPINPYIQDFTKCSYFERPAKLDKGYFSYENQIVFYSESFIVFNEYDYRSWKLRVSNKDNVSSVRFQIKIYDENFNLLMEEIELQENKIITIPYYDPSMAVDPYIVYNTIDETAPITLKIEQIE